jgi:hypothetical protein
MLCPNDKEREFTEIWKFPPFRDASDGANAPICGFTPEQVVFGDGSIRTTDPSGPNLQLYQFTNLPVTYVKHVGETNPYRGWYARFIGDLVPAVDMYTTWRARGPSLVATLLWPTPGGAAPPVKSFNKGGVENAQDTAAFSAVLKNGDTLAYAESASGPRRLEAVGVRITGELLLVTRQGRAIDTPSGQPILISSLSAGRMGGSTLCLQSRCPGDSAGGMTDGERCQTTPPPPPRKHCPS